MPNGQPDLRWRRCSACTTSGKLPPYHRKGVAAYRLGQAHAAGQARPGKVAVCATCYVNYNEPRIGDELLAVLDHNEIPYVLVEKEACCGMPKLELGDLDAVERLKRVNIPPLAKLAPGLRDPDGDSRPAR